MQLNHLFASEMWMPVSTQCTYTHTNRHAHTHNHTHTHTTTHTHLHMIREQITGTMAVAFLSAIVSASGGKVANYFLNAGNVSEQRGAVARKMAEAMGHNFLPDSNGFVY